jgi:hypothetical protein
VETSEGKKWASQEVYEEKTSKRTKSIRQKTSQRNHADQGGDKDRRWIQSHTTITLPYY